jgi:hypothetical protein
MHPATKLLPQLLQPGSHPFARRFPPYDESTLLGPTVMREAQEVEGLRFSLTTFPAVGLGIAPELDHSALETLHQIVGVANRNPFALRHPLPPGIYPLIKNVMQV